MRLWIPSAHVYADKDRQETVIQDSGLDWTIVRPARLITGPATGRYQVHTDNQYRATTISRGDVAEFVLDQLDSDHYLRRTVALTT